jgi:hypothetical protein
MLDFDVLINEGWIYKSNSAKPFSVEFLNFANREIIAGNGAAG